MSKHFCKNCLLREGMPMWLHPVTIPEFALPIRIGADSLCSVCTAYQRWDSAALRRKEQASVKESDCRRAIALYSGGKDSTAMLLFAKEKLGYELTAVLYDNGFIPRAAIEQARKICSVLSVELVVIDGSSQSTKVPTVENALKNLSPASETPCVACARGTLEGAFEIARGQGTPWIFQGTNYFAEWKSVPRGIKTVQHGGVEQRLVNIPYVFGLKRDESRRLLDRLGYEAIKLSGVSTNCLVPARVQTAIADRLGHVPEMEDLSLEVIVGHVTRSEALAELREKAPAHVLLVENA